MGNRAAAGRAVLTARRVIRKRTSLVFMRVFLALAWMVKGWLGFRAGVRLRPVRPSFVAHPERAPLGIMAQRENRPGNPAWE